jgi:F-type H+-transporting ATPase subunit epsilon
MLRTPRGLLVDRPIERLAAEDLDGWFGVEPGRTDVVAALPAGLLVFEDDEGETFVALAGGLLDLREGDCRVMVREAVISRDLDAIAEEVDAHLDERRRKGGRERDAMGELATEALRRLAEEQKT